MFEEVLWDKIRVRDVGYNLFYNNGKKKFCLLEINFLDKKIDIFLMRRK